jgi:hypothetical protein
LFSILVLRYEEIKVPFSTLVQWFEETKALFSTPVLIFLPVKEPLPRPIFNFIGPLIWGNQSTVFYTGPRPGNTVIGSTLMIVLLSNLILFNVERFTVCVYWTPYFDNFLLHLSFIICMFLKIVKQVLLKWCIYGGICVKPNTQERFYKPGSDSVKEIGIYYPPKMAK